MTELGEPMRARLRPKAERTTLSRDADARSTSARLFAHDLSRRHRTVGRHATCCGELAFPGDGDLLSALRHARGGWAYSRWLPVNQGRSSFASDELTADCEDATSCLSYYVDSPVGARSQCGALGWRPAHPSTVSRADFSAHASRRSQPSARSRPSSPPTTTSSRTTTAGSSSWRRWPSASTASGSSTSAIRDTRMSRWWIRSWARFRRDG